LKKQLNFNIQCYSAFATILLVDQLLLPMFYIGNLSFKIGYALLLIWLVRWAPNLIKNSNQSSDVRRIFFIFFTIIVCIFFGEIYLASFYNVSSYKDLVRNLLTFFLASLAFGLGRSTKNFQFEWLLIILFSALALNFAFIIYKDNLPFWLINFYYPQKSAEVMGFNSVEEIMDLTRPRGLFGNPNATMLLININALGIYIALKNHVLVIRSITPALFLVFSPIVLAAALASRGEFIVACIYGALNFYILRSTLHKLSLVVALGLLGLITAGGILFTKDMGNLFLDGINRIYSIVQLFSEGAGSDDSVARPLIQLELFLDRFLESPLFGAGVSPADVLTLSGGTQYFHNDWFYLSSVSGLIGLISMLFLLRFFSSKLGWAVLIPFILPGLVNTFILNVPALISYFLLMGLLISHKPPHKKLV
jgi:hypothetical protein